MAAGDLDLDVSTPREARRRAVRRLTRKERAVVVMVAIYSREHHAHGRLPRAAELCPD